MILYFKPAPGDSAVGDHFVCFTNISSIKQISSDVSAKQL